MAERSSLYELEEDISIHIFSVSAALVGVCLTVISIVRVVVAGKLADTFADDLLAVDASLFLGACLLSYWALRTRRRHRMHRVEQIADLTFLAGLLLMAVVCGLITFEIV